MTPARDTNTSTAEAEKPSLVVVSNRIPVSFVTIDGRSTAKVSSGGLVSALEPLLREHGGLWVGSAGTTDSPEIRAELEAATREHDYRYAPLFLTPEEEANFYEGFSNEVLWPLFHDLQSRCVFNPVYWDFYQQVNRRFAEIVIQNTRKDDLIWVQDYQLLQVGSAIREQRRHACLAFFLHTPFPPPDIFEKLPWSRQILRGLLDYDFIGVQTTRDERNLAACLRSFLPDIQVSGRGEGRRVTSERGNTTIEAMPISIDYQEYARAAHSDAVLHRMREIRSELPGLQIALGVDRLDYTKGIPERLKAFRSLLRTQKDFHRKITLIQVVVPSREGIPGYKALRSEVEELISSINGDFSEPGWTPIHYIHRSLPREELLALYRAADIALVTPLKDGMNLVAKEYCAAQVDHSGVLILSEFAGAAPELRTGAILVNPYDELGVAAALLQATQMPERERHRRMVRLRRQIRCADIHVWRDRFFAGIEAIEEREATAQEP